MAYIRALGDAAAPLSEEDWRARMLASQEENLAAYRRWQIEDAKMRRYQIAATLAIPLAAAVWKFILGRRSTPIT